MGKRSVGDPLKRAMSRIESPTPYRHPHFLSISILFSILSSSLRAHPPNIELFNRDEGEVMDRRERRNDSTWRMAHRDSSNREKGFSD